MLQNEGFKLFFSIFVSFRDLGPQKYVNQPRLLRHWALFLVFMSPWIPRNLERSSIDDIKASSQRKNGTNLVLAPMKRRARQRFFYV